MYQLVCERGTGHRAAPPHDRDVPIIEPIGTNGRDHVEAPIGLRPCDGRWFSIRHQQIAPDMHGDPFRIGSSWGRAATGKQNRKQWGTHTYQCDTR